MCCPSFQTLSSNPEFLFTESAVGGTLHSSIGSLALLLLGHLCCRTPSQLWNSKHWEEILCSPWCVLPPLLWLSSPLLFMSVPSLQYGSLFPSAVTGSCLKGVTFQGQGQNEPAKTLNTLRYQILSPFTLLLVYHDADYDLHNWSFWSTNLIPSVHCSPAMHSKISQDLID